jgi:hypothetical protein
VARTGCCLHSATVTVELVSFVATTTWAEVEARPHPDVRLAEIRITANVESHPGLAGRRTLPVSTPR